MTDHLTVTLSRACLVALRDAMARLLADGVLVGPNGFIALAHRSVADAIKNAGEASQIEFTARDVSLYWLVEFAQCRVPTALQELRDALGMKPVQTPVVNSEELHSLAETAKAICDEHEGRAVPLPVVEKPAVRKASGPLPGQLTLI